MKTVQTAKKRLLVNIGSNILAVAVSAIVGIWLTRYLIQQLGLAVYGMVPLVMSVVSYLGILTLAISGTVGRFVAIHLNRGDKAYSNIYFSTAFIGLLVLCVSVLPILAVATFFLPKLFQIPLGCEAQGRWLFSLVVLFSLITSLTSPFLVSTFVRHRFDLSNSVKIFGRLVQIGTIVFCFRYIAVSVKYVGLAYMMMALSIFFCSVLLTIRLTPELQIRRKSFRWFAMREMGTMGAWITVNQFGATLFLSIGILVVNWFLGSEYVGRYAPFAQWAVLLDLLSSTIVGIFTPIAYDYIARNNISELARQTRRSIKFMSIVMALPAGLICGLASPIFEVWLGPSFAELSPLIWLLIGLRIITFSIRPIFAINQGVNKVKIPSMVTILAGVVSFVGAMLLVKYTHMGLYGVALATSLGLAGKNFLFVPIYGATIMNQKKTVFYKEIVLGLLLVLGLALPVFAISSVYNLATFPRLVVVSSILALMYLPMCYWLVMNRNDRRFMLSLIPLRKESHMSSR
jgi:O-antigen/teichoic acid export membrane protein